MVNTLSIVTVGAALAILIGIAGVIVPVLPGTTLVVLAVVVWAFVAQSVLGCWVAGACGVIAMIGCGLQYLIPGRSLKSAGVPQRTLVTGALAGVVGFFVIPVAGLPIGFVAGIAGAEFARLRRWDQAWPSTRHALRAALMSYGIELSVAMTMAILWGIAVWRVVF